MGDQVRAEQRFTKRGTYDWYDVGFSAQIIPAQRGTVLLRFIVDKSNESLDIKMSKAECWDLMEQLALARKNA